MFHVQLRKHVPASTSEEKIFNASLGFLAHSYTRSPIEKNPCVPIKDMRHSLTALRKNDSIIITKPDKGSGIVVLNKKDYFKKMMVILDDKSKFEHLGPVQTTDKTRKREEGLRKFLSRLVKNKELSKEVYEMIRPIGSQRPRLYGLPKTHKAGVPLRPILSMVASPQHKLAKHLNCLLQPVVEKFSRYTLKDSFSFTDRIKNTSASNTFMASFDVSSLFTNVPLDETIDICADVLFQEDNTELKRASFVKLMKLATSSTEFSFNENMYRQSDGVAMGSPLGPTLANIFMGYLEENYFSTNVEPLMYVRYVDDCFILLKNEDDCRVMF